jgi:hypothetical protein
MWVRVENTIVSPGFRFFGFSATNRIMSCGAQVDHVSSTNGPIGNQ